MSCSSTEALFERFLDDELPAGARTAVIAHVDRCAGCRSVLEELRVVDALLIRPRQVELAPNFTFATMAEARALPPPTSSRPPIRAYLVAYVVGAWLLAAVAMAFAPLTMRALAETTLDIARSITGALGALGAAIARLLGRGGSALTAALAGLLVLDAALVTGCGLVFKYVRPRLAERMRS
jgi:predicted anti-sigma-YlaC factor YlaD